MDIVFWSIALVVSSVVLYLVGFITGWNAAVKDQKIHERDKKKEPRYRPF